jgi:hypothetical protein
MAHRALGGTPLCTVVRSPYGPREYRGGHVLVNRLTTWSIARLTFLWVSGVALAVAVLGGCASHHKDPPQFSADAPYSKKLVGSSDSVCWSVKRALLSQGYLLDRSSEPGVLTGTRDYQPSDTENVDIRLQTTCAGNTDGTSIVFATAVKESSRLQKMKQSTSAGIGPATLTYPSGSAKVLGVQRRETIQDPHFYDEFFDLVQQFVAQEPSSPPQETRAEAR